VEVFPPSIW
jgi:hypothetical protein